ncbi:MAG TPA: c-type cytochrome, partial [Thermoanaerobaculia bacterium]
ETEPSPCRGIVANRDRMAGVLSSVPRYGSSYVLIVPTRLAEKIPGPNATEVANLEVGVRSGTDAGDAARAIGITHIRTYPLDGSPLQPLKDVADGKLDAAVIWAPLAGLGILELSLDQGQVALFTIDKPHAAPPSLRAARVTDPCAGAILDALNVSGVLPAELLVSVDIRTFIGTPAPHFDLEQARAGAPIYEEFCSRCHGPAAVADPKGLAPVDLRISIQRFTYAGFKYIVLNGRPSRSMPPLRGTVSEEQIPLIYQFLKARSQELLPGPAKESQ